MGSRAQPGLCDSEPLGRQLFLLCLQALNLCGVATLAQQLDDLVAYGTQYGGQNQSSRYENDHDMAVCEAGRAPLSYAFRYKDNVHYERYRPRFRKLP